MTTAAVSQWLACAALTMLVVGGAHGVQGPPSEATLVGGQVTEAGTGIAWSGGVVELVGRGGVAVPAETDNQGRFSVRDLPPGRYTVRLAGPGFVSSRHSGPSVIDLQAGQIVEGLRFGVIRSSAIAGRILTADGLPVPSATVVAMQIRYDATGQEILAPPNRTVPWDTWAPGWATDAGLQVETDAAGNYGLYDLEPGEYSVAVWPDLETDGTEGVAPAWYYPGTSDPAFGAKVVLRSGVELGGIDIRLAEEPGYRVTFQLQPQACDSRVYSTRFHIVRNSANGLRTTEGARRVIHEAGVGQQDASEDFEAWVLHEVFPGSYDIFYSSCYAGSRRTLGHLPVRVTDEDVDAGTLVEPQALPLRGRVTLGERLSADLLARRPAVLIFRDLDGRTPYVSPSDGIVAAGIAPNTVRPDGIFEYPLLPGRYAVNVLNLGDPDAYVASARLGGREVLASGFTWDAGSGNLDLVVDGPGGIVEGVVRDGDRRSVAGVQVVLIPSPERRSNPTLFQTATTDQSGVFSFRRVPPGDYGLLAWAEVQANSWLNARFLARYEPFAVAIRTEKGTVVRQDVSVIAE